MRLKGGNPVYKREMTVRTRNMRVPFILLIFNGCLAAVSLVGMYTVVSGTGVSPVRYAGFVELYGSVMTFEFFLIAILTPALTAGSISGERERKTLDLLLSTDMSPADIIIGKLMSALCQVAVLIISSVPIVFLTFIYGSVNLRDLAELMICFAVTAAFTGSVGIFFSSFMKRSTVSYVCTYLTLAVIMGGTVFLSVFGRAASFMSGYRILASLAVQAVISLLLVWGAVILLDPKRHGKNTRRR